MNDYAWFIFTFAQANYLQGVGQLEGRYVRLYGTAESTRAEMHRRFGAQWAGQYEAELGEGIVSQHRLIELILSEEQRAVVDRTITERDGRIQQLARYMHEQTNPMIELYAQTLDFLLRQVK